MSETNLRNQILDWLKYKNIFAWLTNTMGNYNPKSNSWYKNSRLTKGVADIICLHNGKLIAIECKQGKNQQSEYQKWFQLEVIQNGGDYLLAYDLSDVEEYFKNN